MTVIQLPEWKGWRIEGKDLDWQMQELVTDAKAEGGKRWKGTNFWPSADYAIAAAYERMLKEGGGEYEDIAKFVAECGRVKKRLLDAVRKAVS